MHLSHLTNLEQLSLVNNPCVLSNSSWRLYLLYPSLIKCNVRLILGFVNQDYQSCIYQPQLRVSRMDFRRVSLNQKEWLTFETSPLEFVGANFHAQPSPLTVPCFYLPTNAVLLRIETTSSSIIFVQPSLMWYGVAYCFNIYINVQFQQRWRGEGRGGEEGGREGGGQSRSFFIPRKYGAKSEFWKGEAVKTEKNLLWWGFEYSLHPHSSQWMLDLYLPWLWSVK